MTTYYKKLVLKLNKEGVGADEGFISIAGMLLDYMLLKISTKIIWREGGQGLNFFLKDIA